MAREAQRRHDEALAKLPLSMELPCSHDIHTLIITPEMELLVDDHDIDMYAAFRAFGAGRPPKCVEVWEAWQRSPGQGLRKLAPPPEDVLTIAWAGDEELRGYVGLNWKGLPIEKRYALLMASNDRWLAKAMDQGAVLGGLIRGEYPLAMVHHAWPKREWRR
jgi:hypothetical protein